MFEPEIDRRCLSCGASVRKRAAFCPQCGQMLDKPEDERDEADHSEPIERVEELDQTEAEYIEAQPTNELSTNGIEDDQAVSNELTHVEDADSPTEKLIVREHEENDGAEPAVSESSAVTIHDGPKVYETQPLIANTRLSNPTVADLADTNFHRPGDAPPRRKEGQVLARVDKIRKVSSVMIDQAAYDPSLRFLLVAGVLFVVFVILMILSKVLG
jgi:zinc-ribbon domain